jgi:hypothetical protein
MELVGLGDVEDFAEVTRELYAAPDESGPLQHAVDLAIKLIAGCSHAGVSIVQGRNIVTPRWFRRRGVPRGRPAVPA